MAENQVLTLNFGLLHKGVEFDYSLDLDNLPDELRDYRRALEDFTLEELHLLRWRMIWKAMAREKQLPPREFDEFEKTIWGIRSGRGFGKTLAAANWIGGEAAMAPALCAVVAPTHDDVRYTCFEGPTGLMSVIPKQLIVDRNVALPSVTLWNGSFIRGFAGDTPERLRGPQHHAAWCDEIASWKYPEDAWSNLQFGLRLGQHPRIVWTSTLKPKPFIRNLVKDKKSVIVQGSTYENRDNLTEMFFDNVAKYEGTKIGRQELLGELLDPEESGFVKRSQWRMWPHDRLLPKFQYILMSLDTAFTEDTHDKKKQENDPTACSVWGLFTFNKQKHVLLLDAWEDYLGFPELIKRVKKERVYTYGDSDEPMLRPRIVPREQRPRHQGKKIDLILIETKGSGISLRQSLATEDILTSAYNPGKLDKLARLHDASPAWAHGRVWATESEVNPGNFKGWADPLISQVCSYTGEGSLDHDDLLDTTTQAIRYFLKHHIGVLTVKKDPEEARREAAREAAKKVKGARNPYDS